MPEKITMDKATLLKILERNFELHKKIYKNGMECYREKFIKTCETILEKARNDNKFDLSHLETLMMPVDRSQDYEDTIKMIKMHVPDSISISAEEFRRYILNKWDWIRSFKMAFWSNFRSSSSSWKSVV